MAADGPARHGDGMHSFARSPWAAVVATVASALPLAALVAVSNPMPEGACSGIGWGCSLYGWDAAGLALLLLGVPYVVLLVAVVALLHLLPARHRAAPVRTVAWAGFALPWIVVVASTLA